MSEARQTEILETYLAAPSDQTIVTLCTATGTGAGSPVAIPAARMLVGSIPIHVSGTFVGTVAVEGTIATQSEVDGLTAVWTQIEGGSFTTPTLTAVFTAPTHIRANVTAYTSGTINIKGLI